jgi:peptidyl-prolyl cis-trans isomerase SurA
MLKRPLNTLAALACVWGLAMPAAAGGLFSAAIRVNEGVITNFELQQRQLFLEILKFPGVPSQLARDQLIEERLKQQEAKKLGISVPAEALQAALDDYASRANLTSDQFIEELGKAGVDKSTLVDFLSSAIMWAEVVRVKFGPQSAISEEQVERTVNSNTSGTSLEVSLSEIIMALDPDIEEEVQARAQELSKITWQKLDTLPPILQPLIFGLAPGDVTEPLQIPNAVAIFQLRDIRETPYQRPTPGAVDYALYQFPSEDTKTLASLRANLVHCDDLYAWAKGNPTHSLIRESRAPAEIATDLQSVLTPLDDNEFIVQNTGNWIALTMLCGRAPNLDAEAIDMAQIRTGLRNQRLDNFAKGYLENLRNDARIVYK